MELLEPIEPTDLSRASPGLKSLLEKFLMTSLAQANDFAEFTFNQIGDFLDEEKSKISSLAPEHAERKAFSEAVDFYCEIILCLEDKKLIKFLGRTAHDLHTALTQSETPPPLPDEFLSFANEL